MTIDATKIYVPDETTACSLGADEVAQQVAEQLERNSIAAELVRNGSRGAFHLEPLLEVEVKGKRLAFGPMTGDAVAGLFEGGALPRESHPLCLGVTDQIPFLASQSRLTFARAGVIAPLDYLAFQASGGLQGLRQALSMGQQESLVAIEESGLRGRGGAAFPAGIKWRTVADASSAQKYVVCNADEGDSGTFADRLLMECDPFQLIEAMVLAGVTVGATLGFIYLRSEYPKAAEVMTSAINRARQEGLLGASVLDSGRAFDLELRIGAGAYICGEETAMLESIEGKRGMVRKKPPVPALEGLFGKPTLVHNVLTLAAATTIFAQGAAAYAKLGVGRSLGTMPFQLGGNLAQGGLVELPFGVTLNELLREYGQGTLSGRPIEVVQVGGPLGAYLTSEKWSTPLDYEAYAEVGAMIGHGGIVVFDDTVDVAAQAEFAMQFCATESCGKCTPCRIGSTRGVELIQKLRRGEQTEANLQLLEDLMETMELGSLCALGGLTPAPIRSILSSYPDVFASDVFASDLISSGGSDDE
jgi:formate dehydrogenase iron-sulfur subunit